MCPVRMYAGAVATLLACSSDAALAVSPNQRTANLADSWLVLYNHNSAGSVAWAEWYRHERGIPEGNLLGLSASLDEHLPDLASVQAQIITPVRDLLAADPVLNQSIMGIILGYRLPGHYAAPPLNSSVGGFSVADALSDMSDDGLAPASQKGTNTDNPHMSGNILPPGGRKTRASMAANRYMVARIDAPSLAQAKALTERAMRLGTPSSSLFGESVWFDYWDPTFPSSNHEWYWLRSAVQAPLLADLPWDQFDLSNAGAPETRGDAFRFHIYRLNGWQVGDLDGSDGGSRVLGFDLNSWGAVTVRSTVDNGRLFVPNAIAAGYAAAVGATGEPQCCVGPFPDTLLAALQEGWTMGEAFYLANPFNDWMWTLVGDPFLTLPNWFETAPPPPAATVTGASSWKSHALRGEAGLTVNHVGRVEAGNATTEPRAGGIVQLRIQFDTALQPGVVNLAGSAIALAQQRSGDPNAGTSAGYSPSDYAGSISTAASSGNDLVLSFNPALPNATTYRISIGGEVTGVPGQSVEVRALLGDATGSGQVNAADRSAVLGVWTGTGYSAKTDVDLSGSTDVNDRILVIAAWTSPENSAP